jgi:apolipoprotein D and lipocalin family protein
MFKAFIISTLALVGIVNAGISTGQCPTPQLQENFNAAAYMGLWNEQARDAGMPWESNDCQQARYSINPDGTVAVLNSQYDPKADKVTEAAAVATFNGAQGKVKFFPYAPAGDYRVLYTDYENVVVVYSCDSYLLAKTEYIWILTRSQEPIEAFIYQGLQVLKEKVPTYDQTQIRRTLQGSTANCKYLETASYEVAQE